MRKFLSFLILSVLVTATVLGAQTGTMRLKGKVLDSTSLPMAATTVKVYQGNAEPKEGATVFKEGVTDNNGDFDLEVPPGDYYIDISAPDFNSFKQAIRATANTPPLAVTLSVKVVETVVNVDSNTGEVGIDATQSLTTDTLTGDALLDLPDNEEDLLAYLTELAAARGIVDGELNIRIDGFENTAFLPNRSEIQEIRIVNNSFDAGGGGTGPRIEIVTRPGTGVWTGNVGFQFADESLNAKQPLTSADSPKPASQTRNIDAQLRGPILPGRVQAVFNIRNQETEDEGNAIRAVGINGPIDEGISRIRKGRTFAFRPNVTLSKNHQLNTNFSYSDSRTNNGGVGGFNLPERATNQKSYNWSIQVTETANLKPTLRNEFRVQIQRRNNSTTPLTNAFAVNVQDSFNGGGAPNRNSSNGDDFFIGNTVRWQASRTVTLTMAGEANYHKSHSDSRNNYLGTYTFSSLHDYCYATGFIGSECQKTLDIVNGTPEGGIPTFESAAGLIPITGVPTQFRITTGNPIMDVSQAEFVGYLQGEWRFNPRAQLSFGARYQAQQHLDDYNNIAPTVGLSYQLSTKQNWQTVLRVGGRMNYQTYSMNNWEQLLRNQGASPQTTYQIQNPTFPILDLSTLGELANNAPATATSLRTRAGDYASGYSIQPSISVDQSLPRGHRLSFNFQLNRGVHQSRNRNINAPFPGTQLPTDILAMLNFRSSDPLEQAAVRAEGRALVNAMRPDPLLGDIIQNESSGSSLGKNFSIQYRANNKRIFWNRVMIGGTVTWNMNWAQDNNATAVNAYDLAAEWGRSGQDQRHRVTATFNVQVPWNLRFSVSSLGYTSGRPYTITTGSDYNGDGTNNDRPIGVGRNTETGPSTWNAINLNVTKLIPLGGARRPAPSNDYAEPQRGGGGFGGGGGGFGGGGGGGNRGGNAGRSIEFSVSVTNLLNSTIRQGISGVLSSPLYGQPTGGGRGRTMQLSLRTNLGQLF